MEPISVAVTWLLGRAGEKFFETALDWLLAHIGLQTPAASMRIGDVSLLERSIERIERELLLIHDKIDEDRLARLKAAFSQLGDAHRTTLQREFLAQAHDSFRLLTYLPEWGMTGKWRNGELRCLAFLGIAAAHQMLHDPRQLIAENLVGAIQADPPTAQLWLGKDVVQATLGVSPALLPRRRSLVARTLYFLVIGWWLGFIWLLAGYVLCLSVLFLFVGLAMFPHLPAMITLGPRSGVGKYELTGRTRSRPRQRNFLIRGVYFVSIGWWWGFIWALMAYFLCLLIVTMPLGCWILNRLPAFITLRRSSYSGDPLTRVSRTM